MDKLNRVTAATTGVNVISYTYDANGNTASKTAAGVTRTYHVFSRFAISATLAYSLIAAYSNFPPNRMHANSHLPRSGSRKTVSEDAK